MVGFVLSVYFFYVDLEELCSEPLASFVLTASQHHRVPLPRGAEG